MQGRTEKLDRALGNVNANFGQDWKKTIDEIKKALLKKYNINH